MIAECNFDEHAFQSVSDTNDLVIITLKVKNVMNMHFQSTHAKACIVLGISD